MYDMKNFVINRVEPFSETADYCAYEILQVPHGFSTRYQHVFRRILLDLGCVTRVEFSAETIKAKGRAARDNLILQVWTDGSVSACDAITIASNILVADPTIIRSECSAAPATPV